MTFNEGAYGAGGYPVISKEQWDTMPFTSEHLWKADHKGIASGNCTKCGKPVDEWNDKMKALANPTIRKSLMVEEWKKDFAAKFYVSKLGGVVPDPAGALKEALDFISSKLQEAYRQGMVDADVRAYEIEKKVREEALREVELKIEGMKLPEKRGHYGPNDHMHIQSNIGYNEALSDLLAAIKEGKL